MEPNRLEREFKKKLDQRTIQPTEMAWDRLDAMLSVAEKKKPKRTWMYIAASFLGFLLVGTLFLKQGDKETNTVIIKDATVVENNHGAPTIKAEAPTPAAIQEIITTGPAVAAKQQEAIAAVPASTQKKAIEKANTPRIKNNKQEIPIANEAMASVTEKENKVNVAAETEILLASADTGNNSNIRSLVKVNANSLLSSVEGELNDSFRNKALQTVTKNYNAIRVSLANRNHQ